MKKSGFDSASHQMVQSSDGSYTAYSSEYDEHYHSTKDGALNESLYKHVIPTFALKADSTCRAKSSLKILDICFGLGFNTLATLYYIAKSSLNLKLHIVSPELDEELVRSLVDFEYPVEFAEFKEIVYELSANGCYEDEDIKIELFFEDARAVVKRYEKYFDIVYQDAFSPKVNPSLWTLEYFGGISKAMSEDGVISTYSTALKSRLAMYYNGFNIYLNRSDHHRNSTIASKVELDLEKVDMEHKISCNKEVEPLRD